MGKKLDHLVALDESGRCKIMRRIIPYFWNHKLFRSLSRFTLIGSVAFILSTFFSWNSPRLYTQARNLSNQNLTNNISPLNINQNLTIVITNCTSLTAHCPEEKLIYISDSLQNISQDWLKENLVNYSYQLLYSAGDQNPENKSMIEGRIYTVEPLPNLEIATIPPEEKDFNNWKTALFITGGFTTWLTIETFLNRRKAKAKFSVEEMIQLQQQQENFKQKIESLVKEIDQIQDTLADVTDNKKALQTLIAAKNAELEQVRKEAREFEKYVLEENQFLEKENHSLLGENQELSLQLSSAKEEIHHLQITLNNSKKQTDFPVLKQENLGEIEEEFLLAFSQQAISQLFYLAKNDQKKYKKVLKTLSTMSTNLRHNSLQTHEYAEFSGMKGEKVFESYVEAHTPGAWRIFWYYGPGQGFLTIDQIIPHP